jgi:hypothetical protein
VVNHRVLHRAAVTDDRLLHIAALKLSWGEETGGGVDGALGVVELKGGFLRERMEVHTAKVYI